MREQEINGTDFTARGAAEKMRGSLDVLESGIKLTARRGEPARQMVEKGLGDILRYAELIKELYQNRADQNLPLQSPQSPEASETQVLPVLPRIRPS